MEELKVRAPAKVNIALDVIGRRPDGYHLMQMINHSTNLADVLSFKPAEELTLTCDEETVPLGPSNLIMKVAQGLKTRYGVKIGAAIHLEKRIPMQAGLAGGSADAAAAIKGLSTLWGLEMDIQEMLSFGVGIGADVPYCLLGGTALVEGIGEIITPLKPLPACTMVVVKPAADIATPWAFAQVDTAPSEYHPPVEQAVEVLESQGFEAACEWMGNSFEAVVFPLYPEIKILKEQMLDAGAALAVMSGSGSTVVGYFMDEAVAAQAVAFFKDLQMNPSLARIE